MCRKKELFEDTKEVFKSCKLRKDRKKQWPKDKRTNNDLQNITQKSPPKTRGELRCSERVSSSCSICGTCHVTISVIGRLAS